MQERLQFCDRHRMNVALSPHGTHTLYCNACKHVWRRGVPVWYGAIVARRYNRMVAS